jgi:SAM-dependent methyltransferase
MTSATVQSYDAKPEAYFSGVRTGFIDKLSRDPTRAILEIGCGDGATGQYAKATGKCGRYVGVELMPVAADIATGRLDKVYIGNIEALDLPEPEESFGALIASEVLEHLVDPWALLRRLNRLLSPGAQVIAGSPNVAHISTVKMLLKGRWDLEDSGRMDRTHLRWFTPESYAQMFRDCGFEVLSVEAHVGMGPRQKVVNALTGGMFSHLFVSQIVVVARKPG